MGVSLVNIVDGSLGQLTTVLTTYGNITNAQVKINNATLTNTNAIGGANGNATVYIVPSGDTAGAKNMVINAKPLLGGETYDCPELVNKNILNGGKLQALAGGNSTITLLVSGIALS